MRVNVACTLFMFHMFSHIPLSKYDWKQCFYFSLHLMALDLQMNIKIPLFPKKGSFLLCAIPSFCPLPYCFLPFSLCLHLSFNLEHKEIFHSSIDRHQIVSMNSFKLNCLGESKFAQEKSNLDDKCHEVPDGTPGEILISLPAHVPSGLSVLLCPLFLFASG